MAIGVETIVRTMGSWLTRERVNDKVEDCKPVQETAAGALCSGWGALDVEESLRVRKAKLDLMTLESFNRGY